jgi:hypothetical protein
MARLPKAMISFATNRVPSQRAATSSSEKLSGSRRSPGYRDVGPVLGELQRSGATDSV